MRLGFGVDAPRKVLSLVAQLNEYRRPGVAMQAQEGNVRYETFDIKQFFPHLHPDELRATVLRVLELLDQRHGGRYRWF